MTTASTVPVDYNYAELFDSKKKPRKLSAGAVVAISVSLAAHLGVGVYFATQKFILPEIFDNPDPIIDVTMGDVPPPPPPPSRNQQQPAPKDPPKSLDVRQPLEQPVVTNTVQPMEVAATEKEAPRSDLQIAAAISTTGNGLQQIIAPPIPTPPAPKVIRNPTWLSKPSPDQLGRLYPSRAIDRGITGGATLQCEVTLTGAVRNCSVVDESPKGHGFGDAALSSSRLFKMNPRTVDGESVEGARVRIPIAFNLG